MTADPRYGEISYRGWLIYPSSLAGTHGHRYEYRHESYDPTPQHSDDPPADNRCGLAHTIKEAQAEIDEYEGGLPDEVFVCSNPHCDAVWTADPQGHCPKCLQPSGVGWSTMSRHLMPLPEKAS